jgi:hypothetical protein
MSLFLRLKNNINNNKIKGIWVCAYILSKYIKKKKIIQWDLLLPNKPTMNTSSTVCLGMAGLEKQAG